MMDIHNAKNLLIKISEIGQKKVGLKNSSRPQLQDLLPFRYYFDKDGNLKRNELEKIDGLWTRREILTRYLFLQAILDQGPDIEGIRLLLTKVVNSLYKKGIRLLHNPLDFFREIGISIDEILQKHRTIKNIRSETWARENKTTPNKYNLFMDNSKQVLGYAVYRWGVPLCLPYLLEKDFAEQEKEFREPLVDYLENSQSAEKMSQKIKNNERYGLGKAIGNKACHLFAKWYIHTFKLAKKDDISWGNISYELPLDSNAGRVLFRTGFWSEWATLEEYKKWNVIQKNAGKEKKNYIRVTNIRGKKSKIASLDSHLMDIYKIIAISYLKTHLRSPRKIEIQRIPNILLYDTDYGIGDLDDGLIYIGTNFCYNHDAPVCSECPINSFCASYKKNPELISDYRT